MPEAAGVLLLLPDGRLVMQRRTQDAPLDPGLLTFFGGGLEGDETPDIAVRRELAEETDLDPELLEFELAAAVPVSAEQLGRAQGLRAHLYKVAIPSHDFAVYEGDGAEAYTLAELKARSDVSKITIIILTNIYGEDYGA